MIEPILSHENLRHVISWINNGPWSRPAVARVPDQVPERDRPRTEICLKLKSQK